jgi:UDP-GlcNAc:undecaprenyl-phosphate/decaprenyl-phosphate GlcNAc-1-phosphate transferase
MSFPTILVVIGFGILFGLVTVPLAILASRRFGLLDQPGRHKRHKQPVPILGGTALLVAIWSSLALARLVFGGQLQELDTSLPFILGGALIVYAVGLLDDLKPQTAWVKLSVEIVAALILYWGGLRIDPVSIPFFGHVSLGQFSVVITVLWVVLLTNSINLIDGLDGLAGGVSLIAAMTVTIVGHIYHAGPAMVLAYALIGFLASFLYFNRYPAKIFLGDSGALQLGFYFSVLSLVVPLKSFTAAALYLPLLALGVPILETTSSFFRRLMAGKNVMQADRRHLFHYLSAAGLGPKQIVWVFYALSAVFGGFALAMCFWDRILVFGVLVLFMVVIFGAFLIFMASQARGRRKNSGGNGLRSS